MNLGKLSLAAAIAGGIGTGAFAQEKSDVNDSIVSALQGQEGQVQILQEDELKYQLDTARCEVNGNGPIYGNILAFCIPGYTGIDDFKNPSKIAKFMPQLVQFAAHNPLILTALKTDLAAIVENGLDYYKVPEGEESYTTNDNFKWDINTSQFNLARYLMIFKLDDEAIRVFLPLVQAL